MSQNILKRQVAVVVTTYNNPRSLELCLRSLSNQTYQNFVVHIADDGSRDETRDLILKLKRELAFSIYHHWHPDQGYQKAKINNIVFRQIDPDVFPVLICVDHDVVLHHRFVEDHYLAHVRVDFKPLLFMGRRIDLSAELTSRYTPENVTRLNRGITFDLMTSALLGKTKNVLRSVRLSAPRFLLRLIKRDRVFDLLGSNYSISTLLLIEVNGYNEDYKSYWGEDGDLFVRVRNKNVMIDGLIGYAIQWHLFHPRLEETQEHLKLYEALLSNVTYTECKNGLRKNK